MVVSSSCIWFRLIPVLTPWMIQYDVSKVQVVHVYWILRNPCSLKIMVQCKSNPQSTTHLDTMQTPKCEGFMVAMYIYHHFVIL